MKNVLECNSLLSGFFCERLGSYLKEKSHVKVVLHVQERVAMLLNRLGSGDGLKSIGNSYARIYPQRQLMRFVELLRSIFNQYVFKLQVNHNLGF